MILGTSGVICGNLGKFSKSKKPKKNAPKKEEKKLGVAVVLLANVFFGGGKCPNLGVVNVRILGVVNVLLANDSQSFFCSSSFMEIELNNLSDFGNVKN